jgi:hypothetical protein
MFESEWFQYVFIALIFLLLIWNLTRRRRQSTGNPNIWPPALCCPILIKPVVAECTIRHYQSKKSSIRRWSIYKDIWVFWKELSSDLNKSS